MELNIEPLSIDEVKQQIGDLNLQLLQAHRLIARLRVVVAEQQGVINDLKSEIEKAVTAAAR